MPRCLDGKIALVTGGLSGIGKAIASRMVDEGAIVVAADITTNVTQLGEGSHSSLRMDVADASSVATVFDAVLDRYGRIDCVVNSAGIGNSIQFLETSLDAFDRILSVNLRGTFIVGQAAAGAMCKRGGGSIVNVASISGIVANAGRSAYGASKAGVVLLSKVMAVELARYGIRVNVLAPGPVATPLTAKMHTALAQEQWIAATPMHRYARPEEMAGAVVYLCSDDASFVTGHVLAVDGGFLASGLISPEIGSSDHSIEDPNFATLPVARVDA